MEADLQPPPPDADLRARQVPGTAASDAARSHMLDVVQRFVRAWTYADMPWREAQDAGLLWAPLRKPHENAQDEHWLVRRSFADVDHPEHGRSFRYPTSKWLSNRTSWQVGRRAPLVGEDTAAVLGEAVRRPACRPRRERDEPAGVGNARQAVPPAGRPHPRLHVVPGVGRRHPFFLAAMGAEAESRMEGQSRHAARRDGAGRRARRARCSDRALARGARPRIWAGQFNNKNPGKRGISLNIRHPNGLEIAKDLVRVCDVVAEGFSPGVLQRLGLGYDVLKSIRPDVIYIQQSGMGGHGTYGRMRTVGPVAAAFGGQGEMSGLPEPAMPVGWGYSHLDWVGAYSYALALLGALYHRECTGEGPVDRCLPVRVGLF